MFVSLVNILNKSCQRKQYIGNYQKDSILLIMYSYNVLAGILKEILELKTFIVCLTLPCTEGGGFQGHFVE